MARALVALLLLISSISFTFQQDQHPTSTRMGFDFFTFATVWTPTVCREPARCRENGCFALPGFTIAGLWPDYNDGSWPEFCDCGFNRQAIKHLLPDLFSKWPTLTCDRLDLCYGETGDTVYPWPHEWEKHGTCAFPVLNDEGSYFSKALELYDKYPMISILVDAGFTPSQDRKYATSDIVAAIAKVVKASPEIICQDDDVKHVHLCFEKNFEPRDCKSSGHESSTCPENVKLPFYFGHAMNRGGNQKILMPSTMAE